MNWQANIEIIIAIGGLVAAVLIFVFGNRILGSKNLAKYATAFFAGGVAIWVLLSFPFKAERAIVVSKAICDLDSQSVPTQVRCTLSLTEESGETYNATSPVLWSIADEDSNTITQGERRVFDIRLDQAGEFLVTAQYQGTVASAVVHVNEQEPEYFQRSIAFSLTNGSVTDNKSNTRVIQALPGREIVTANVQIHSTRGGADARIVSINENEVTLALRAPRKKSIFESKSSRVAGEVVVTETIAESD